MAVQQAAPPAPSRWPDYRYSEVTLKYVKRGFTMFSRHLPTFILVPLTASLALELASMLRSGDIGRLWAVAASTDLRLNLVTVVACCSLLAAAALAAWLLRSAPVYLVDFACHRPPDSWKISMDRHVQCTKAMGKFTPENVEFQAKILARGGLGDETYLPPLLITPPPDEQQQQQHGGTPPPPLAAAAPAGSTRSKAAAAAATPPPPSAAPSSTGTGGGPSMSDARWEYEQVAYGAVREVLAKSGVHPRQVGVVITNCSLFNPTPSLSAMVINHFKMPSSTINYSLGGMGCSAGVVAIDLAKQMLQLHPNTYALVVSTENVTQNWYLGNQRSMLIPNCIFRVGGSAVLLSNKRTDGWRAKYVLRHVVRTNLAASDAAFQCVYEQEDAQGHRGVRLSKELMAIAGEALKANITTLGPLVLPISEQLLFLGHLVLRKVLGRRRVRPYIPDFKLAFEHVCIHTGGRGVIDAIEQQLALSPALVEPSRATLYRYGNVSSSSIWYVLAYIEAMQGVRRGDRVWQLAFGSGFKCNSAVWVANRAIRPAVAVAGGGGAAGAGVAGGRRGAGGDHEAWRGFDVDRMRAHLADLPQ